MASIAFYLGLPQEQRETLRTYVKQEFFEFFNIDQEVPTQIPQDRFLPDLSKVDEETAYYFNSPADEMR